MLSIDHCNETLLMRGLILGWIDQSVEFLRHNPIAFERVWQVGKSDGKLGKAVRVLVQGEFI
jgi:hypothetical protein